MADRIKGITIEIGGDTTKLQTALKQVNSASKSTASALRDVNNLLKFNPGNTELLRQKQQLLGNQIKNTKEKLDELKRAQKQMDAAGVDKTSEQYMALQREIIDTEGYLKNLEKEMKQFGSVGAQQIAAVGEKMKALGSQVSQVGQTLTTKVTLPIVAAFTVAAKEASDLEENMNKLDVAFGDSADAVKEWSETAIQQYGLSRVAASQATSGFGALAKGVGVTEEEAAAMSMTLAGLSADLASYFNTGTDVSAKALEAIFTGESEALKKFGVVMTDTNLKQFAEDQNLVWSELSQTEKTMVRYQYVLEKTQDAQGDYARTSDGTANSIKTLKSSLSDLASAFGEQLLPIITPVIQKITEIIQKFSNLSPETQKLIVKIGLITAVVGPLLLILGKVISVIGMVLTFAPAIAAAITAINWPLVAVVAAVVAFIAIIKVLRKAWEEHGEAIKAKAQDIWQSVTEWFSQLGKNIRNIWNNIRTSIATAIDNAKTKVQNTVNNIRSAVSNAFNSIKTTAQNVWNGIRDAITGPIETAKSKLQGIVDGIAGIFAGLRNMIKLPSVEMSTITIGGHELQYPRLVWNARAMKNAVMLDGATIFGAMNGNLYGGGEAGREIIVSYDKLAQMMGAGGTTNINVVVNASQGMNERQLADLVARRIQQSVNNRRAVWA